MSVSVHTCVTLVAKRLFTISACVIWLLFIDGCSHTAEIDQITEEELRGHVHTLASDELAGREVGTAGIEQAEEYIARQFTSFGLETLPGEDDYFLEFPLYTRGFDEENTEIRVERDGANRVLEPGVDFKPFRFSGTGTYRSQIVFAGYGVTASEYDYDDYKELDVDGKIVLIMRHEPNENQEDGKFRGADLTRHAYFVEKAKNARDHGAQGMLLYTDPLNHRPGESMNPPRIFGLDPPKDFNSLDASFLAAHISMDAARRLFAGSGLTLEEIQTRVDNGTQASEIPMPETVAEVSIGRAGESIELTGRNTAAILPGRHRTLSDEWIVIAAHHDHLGQYEGDGDTIFNGADDNASGVSALLEIAERFATEERAPKRSILFTTFSAEEKGLFGSRAIEKNELLDLDRVVFMINLDMIGRNPDQPATVFGNGFSTIADQILTEEAEALVFAVDTKGRLHQPMSDHHIFYENEIPFLMFFTGRHEDYHSPSDHSDKLEYSRMETIATLAYRIASRIAEGEKTPVFE